MVSSLLDSAIDVADLVNEFLKVVIYGVNRCLAGDTPIPYQIRDADGKNQNDKGGSLELLYMRFNGIHRSGKGYYQRPQTMGSSYHVSSVTDEGRLFRNRIENVVESGKKCVFRVTTSTGRSIKATAEHPFLTEQGYSALSDLFPGDEVVINPRVRRSKGSTKPRIRRKHLYVKNHPAGRMKVVNGCIYYRVSVTHSVYEASQNGMSTKEYIRFLNQGNAEAVHNLWHVPKGMEIHHLDENPLNDELSNLFLAGSGGEHQKTFHHGAIRDRFGIYAELDRIVSIEAAGTENVYDIQMEGPYHNFDAGGIMVHNCGKTTLACQFPKPLLLISFEPNKTGGALSVAKVAGVKLLRITTYDDAIRLAAELKGDRSFKSHVLDGATSLQDLALKKLMNLPDLPEQLNWGLVNQDQYRERSEMTKEGLRPFLNLSAHTIVLAKEKDHNPPTDQRNKVLRGLQTESYLASDLGGATVGWLHDTCDYVTRLYLEREVKKVKRKVMFQGKATEKEEEKETGRIIHRLRTGYHPNYAAGLRSSTPEEVPEIVDGENPKELYEHLMAVIQGKGG